MILIIKNISVGIGPLHLFNPSQNICGDFGHKIFSRDKRFPESFPGKT